MKKVKIMLLSLAILTIVGGALAFRIKLGILPMCTAQTNGAASGDVCAVINGGGAKLFCPTPGYFTTVSPTTTVCTTDKQDLDGNGSVECEIPGVATVLCLTTRRVRKG